ncbi:MAG: putative baseplate assembly protein [Nitrosomonas sp.]|uniref:putative baseplate assembly protein n=1 Tax=Nitrosomonas sp. TaxID=42353 RepID=UPI0025F8FD50|nr:putative baseplate assembly protein [Nitrosomonas sp.]UJP02828.1 MAG: putative baseplate assembly protein [Nitrosomonas sp.]
MKARLSSSDYPKLAQLTSRETGDFSLAIMDAWATVADVLTFYQERIANEGFLRTATERRSVLELGRLVGYQPRPGVASSVYLAYTIDDNFKEETIIPKGARSQSIPGPGEMPQSFETSEDLKARAQWNDLKPRVTQPQTMSGIKQGNGKNRQIYLKGISTNLKPNDPLLIDFKGTGDGDDLIFDRIKEIKPNPTANHTLIILQSTSLTSKREKDTNHDQSADPANKLISELVRSPSIQPANAHQLVKNLTEQFAIQRDDQNSSTNNEVNATALRNKLISGEASHATLKAFAPGLQDTFSTAVENANVTQSNPLKVYALRAKAGLFGSNYPGVPYSLGNLRSSNFVSLQMPTPLSIIWPEDLLPDNYDKDFKGFKKIALEPQNDQLVKDTWVVIEYPELKVEEKQDDHKEKQDDHDLIHVSIFDNFSKFLFENNNCSTVSRKQSIFRIKGVEQKNLQARSPIGFSTKADVLDLAPYWLKTEVSDNAKILDCVSLLKETVVYTQSEELELAEEPIEENVCGGTEQLIELDELYEGLESGRWVVVSGERDIPGTGGVRFSELAMLSTVTQNIQLSDDPSGPLPGDKIHSFIKLAEKLAYCFKRDTVRIYGNVVKATHGETRKETLGSGDGAKALQSFTLKQPPLTYVAATNPNGVDSTLKVFVNNVQWHETNTLVGLSSTARNFSTGTGDEGKTTVVFGNGREGARLPTGIENIKAEYRNGIGKTGNVKAEQISLLTTRPLGVKEVINPLRASGGADKETRDQARRNVPLGVKALDRLVSVQDYEDFARIFAGIGKACAVELSDGSRQLVHITIAGADDIPIEPHSDLFRNLQQALLDSGDPYQAIELEIRELMLIVITAGIRILPDYQWESVESSVRTALLDAFSFDRRELGQDVLLSEVISVMQAVRGVAYVDVDIFGGLPEKIIRGKENKARELCTPADIASIVEKMGFDEKGKPKSRPDSRIPVNLARTGAKLPAQLAFMTPDVPATLNLIQIS